MSGSGVADGGRHRAHGRGGDASGGGGPGGSGPDAPDTGPDKDVVIPDESGESDATREPDAPREPAGADAAPESAESEPAEAVMVGPSSDDRPTGPRRQRDPLRATVRGIGQLLITAGLIVLLFVVYEVWVTNLFGEQKQAAATQALDKLWAQETDTVTAPGDPAVVTESGGMVVTTAAGPTLDPGERTVRYDTAEGAGFAKIYVPAFGPDFSFTVVEGTTQADLYAGPGHYNDPMTQYPGQPGNFALAGHRVNKGAPFDDLGLLDSCDAIVIETRDDWYVYRVLPMKDQVASWATTEHAHCSGVDVQTGRYQGVYGREITTPTDIEQIYPVPHVDSRQVPAGAESLITLTTCHPKFSDRQRMIIHGILVKSYPKAAGFTPPEMQETS